MQTKTEPGCNLKTHSLHRMKLLLQNSIHNRLCLLSASHSYGTGRVRVQSSFRLQSRLYGRS